MKIDYNAQYWKSKAVTRNAQMKELKKRIKELSRSRDAWKEKYKENKDNLEKLEKKIKNLKKTIEKIKIY
jgi:chromosome segregation ATPase